MATRFGHQAADGSFEFHDCKKSLATSEQRENSDARAGLFGLIGLLVAVLRGIGLIIWKAV